MPTRMNNKARFTIVNRSVMPVPSCVHVARVLMINVGTPVTS